MTILNQQKSTFVPIARIVNTIFSNFVPLCRASQPISCACTFFILQNDKTCYDFSKNSDFLKNILFRVKSHFLPSISQKNFGGIKFSERKHFFIPENVD